MAKKKNAPEVQATDTAQNTNPESWNEVKPATEVATEAAPKKTRKPKAVAPPASEPTAAPEPEAKPTKKGKRAKGDATLEDVFAGYIESLEADGKTGGTIASYKSELVLAGEELGLDTRIADLKPERVLLFFGCDRVQRKRNKKPKSPLSIAKTQRVVRQALEWAATKKMIAQAPVPEMAASH